MAFGKSQPGTVIGQGETTSLGKDVVFEGFLTMDGDVRIDGHLKGEIHTTGTLTIGEEAVIKGNVTAGTLITSGKINGNVIATEKIKIFKSAILIGDIRTPAISIEGGAHFNGLSDMGIITGVVSHRPPGGKVHALPHRRHSMLDL